MSEPALTPHTAPRTLEGLMGHTPFKLRLLAGELKGLESPEQKQAWHALVSPDARATFILTLLEQWDKANPGLAASPKPDGEAANSNGTSQAAQPVAVPVTPVAPEVVAPPKPAQVSPQAVQAAQQAASDKPKRQTKTEESEVPLLWRTEMMSMLSRLIAETEGNRKSILAIESKLSELSAKQTGVLDVHEHIKEAEGAYERLSEKLEGTGQIQLWTICAFLTFMQDSMGASMPDLLRAAIDDSAEFPKMVRGILGKAP